MPATSPTSFSTAELLNDNAPALPTAYAKHGYGHDAAQTPTTFIYADRELKRFLAWTEGFKPDGYVYAPGLGHEPVRLAVVQTVGA